jgi:hypothetical protein
VICCLWELTVREGVWVEGKETMRYDTCDWDDDV